MMLGFDLMSEDFSEMKFEEYLKAKAQLGLHINAGQEKLLAQRLGEKAPKSNQFLSMILKNL